MVYPSGPRGRFRGKFQQSNEEHRINERIRVPEVRLVDEKGGQVGVVPTREALQMARDKDLDLMEVSPNSRPPVCKIADYGKFKYEKKKKEHAAKKKQAVIKVKEVQVRPNTDVHDFNVKMKRLESFLEEGDKVKVTMLFRGREITHPEKGRKMMDQIVEFIENKGTVESRPKMEGRKMIMVLNPLSARTAAGKVKSAKPKGGKPKDAKSKDAKPKDAKSKGASEDSKAKKESSKSAAAN